MQCTPPEITVEANEAVSCLGPSKSGEKYLAAYQHFIQWCNGKNVIIYSENVLLAYFNQMQKDKKWKSSTMWSRYSMIKSELIIKHGINISQYLKLRCFLKKANEGYSAKKSRIFTKEQFEGFLVDAPDDVYLGIKIVLLIGVTGACRCDEMMKMNIGDIEDMENLILIKIPDSKTKKVRSFTIIGEMFMNIYHKYASLRPRDMQERRFFLKYQNGKCYKNVMGIHTISAVPRKVAEFLKLGNVQEYTGHCLRRTSATLLIDGGGSMESLKRHGGWRSTSVAEGYIEESIRNKKENASRILNLNETAVSETGASGNLITSSSPRSSPKSRVNTLTGSSSSLHGFNFQNATLTNKLYI
ncbi:uncharacterized protein LOC116159960 [Photinus pyralis]|uniref:uncharacterized protein LOC116159960 n=1 Tax=Photinus pyralis TaxID=7054 RepID=UPI001267182E|nr:uncharacterized protein LOC116159960 [Photinus pyralis]